MISWTTLHKTGFFIWMTMVTSEECKIGSPVCTTSDVSPATFNLTTVSHDLGLGVGRHGLKTHRDMATSLTVEILIHWLIPLVGVVVLILNPIIITVICRDRQLRKQPSSIYVANLALVDCALSASTTISVILRVSDLVKMSEIPMCVIFHGYLPFSLITASILFMFTNSVDRYVFIKMSMKYHRIMSTKVAKMVTICIWIYSVFFSAFPFVVFDQYWEYSTCHQFFCSASYKYGHLPEVVMYLLTIVFTIHMFVSVFRVVRGSQRLRRLPSTPSARDSQSTVLSSPPTSPISPLSVIQELVPYQDETESPTGSVTSLSSASSKSDVDTTLSEEGSSSSKDESSLTFTDTTALTTPLPSPQFSSLKHFGDGDHIENDDPQREKDDDDGNDVHDNSKYHHEQNASINYTKISRSFQDASIILHGECCQHRCVGDSDHQLTSGIDQEHNGHINKLAKEMVLRNAVLENHHCLSTGNASFKVLFDVNSYKQNIPLDTLKPTGSLLNGVHTPGAIKDQPECKHLPQVGDSVNSFALKQIYDKIESVITRKDDAMEDERKGNISDNVACEKLAYKPTLESAVAVIVSEHVSGQENVSPFPASFPYLSQTLSPDPATNLCCLCEMTHMTESEDVQQGISTEDSSHSPPAYSEPQQLCRLRNRLASPSTKEQATSSSSLRQNQTVSLISDRFTLSIKMDPPFSQARESVTSQDTLFIRTHSGPVASSRNGSIPFGSPAYSGKDIRTLKILFIMFCVYITLWMPNFVITSLRYFTNQDISLEVLCIGYALGMSNSVFNFFVYPMRVPKLKVCLQRLFRSVLMKLKRKCLAVLRLLRFL